MVVDTIERHFERLRQAPGYERAVLHRRGDGTAVLEVPDVVLPPGWNAPSTTVYVLVPVGYPVAKPDCFWASEQLRLAHGGMPTNTAINSNLGEPQPKLWFSFHPASWAANSDDLYTYLKVVRRRLADVR